MWAPGTRLAQLAAVHVLRRRWIGRALLVAQVAVVLLIARNWAYVTTYRLFLDRRIAATASAAAQQFDIEGARVVPLIVTRGADRVAFATQVGRDSTVRATLRPSTPHAASLSEDGPARPTRYAVEWHDGSARRVLAQGTINRPTDLACSYPGGTGVIEFVSDGAVTWVDPRVVRDLRVVPHALTLAILFLCWLAVTRGSVDDDAANRTPFAVFRFAAAASGVLAALLVSEAALRALGDRIPSGIASERHDLGEVTRDPRWIDSPRYGRRLRAGVNALNEWRHGDIVRMGYIPTPPTGGVLHHFRFQTDAEGFRNPGVRERFDVAALGDSFTDAMTMAVEASWPARLERNLGRTVQNYGTAGFGPQQELLVLKDFVARHRPRVVVLAFFAGNDIFDAEAFDRFERSHGALTRVAPGWPIKEVVTRADTWYVTSAIHALAASFRSPKAEPDAPAEHLAALSRGDAPRYEHGRFFLDVNGHALQLALMPPYLNLLRFSETYLESRPGWALTQRAITDMRDATRRADAEFIVMFLPFKSQIALPTLERRYSRDQLDAAFRSALPGSPAPPSLETMDQNRLAQNRMMRRLCEELGVPLLDVTDALQARFEQGENVYFTDDSHINETGHGVVADALAAFIASNLTVASRR